MTPSSTFLRNYLLKIQSRFSPFLRLNRRNSDLLSAASTLSSESDHLSALIPSQAPPPSQVSLVLHQYRHFFQTSSCGGGFTPTEVRPLHTWILQDSPDSDHEEKPPPPSVWSAPLSLRQLIITSWEVRRCYVFKHVSTSRSVPAARL